MTIPIWPRTGLDGVEPLQPAQAAELATEAADHSAAAEGGAQNLAGANASDLWIGGVRAFEEQSEALETLRMRVAGE